MLKGSKTIKIMKRSKNRRGLKQVKATFFAYKQTRNIADHGLCNAIFSSVIVTVNFIGR